MVSPEKATSISWRYTCARAASSHATAQAACLMSVVVMAFLPGEARGRVGREARHAPARGTPQHGPAPPRREAALRYDSAPPRAGSGYGNGSRAAAASGLELRPPRSIARAAWQGPAWVRLRA